jgi:hypothetical protein
MMPTAHAENTCQQRTRNMRQEAFEELGGTLRRKT